MKLNLSSAAVFAATIALAVAGCGGDDDESSSDSGSTPADTTAQTPPADTGSSGSGGGASTNLTIAADESGQLKFDKTSLSAKAGKVTITMDNPSPVAHAVGIEGAGVDEEGKTVNMGGKSVVTADLKPGKYEFYCPVDGHKAAGMVGELTVK